MIPGIQLDLSSRDINVRIANTGELIGHMHEIVVSGRDRRIVFSDRVRGTEAHGRAQVALAQAGFKIEYRP